MYLNNAYFGNGVWGVQDASRRYFGKNASEVNPSEAATLAGILRNPSFYNPIDHMSNALARRNLILSLMVDNHKLSAAQAKMYQKQGLTLRNTFQNKDGYRYPYFFDAVVDEAISKYGLTEEQVMNKGLKIYTTLNQNYQGRLQDTFNESWLFPQNGSDGTECQGASVAMDPNTGAVRAIIGGRGKHVFRGYNRATQMKRQPGSSIKPLAVYAPALQNGYHYDSQLSNKLQKFGKNGYEPHNVDNGYSNTIPMYQALEESKNVPAVWLLDRIGVSKGVQSVENFGIKVPKSDRNLALALGGLSSGVSPLQMARAYSAFANKGNLPNNSFFITKITDASGNVLAENNNPGSHRIISENTAKEMTTMMLGSLPTVRGARLSLMAIGLLVKQVQLKCLTHTALVLRTNGLWVIHRILYYLLGLALTGLIESITCKAFLKLGLLVYTKLKWKEFCRIQLRLNLPKKRLIKLSKTMALILIGPAV